MERASAFGGRSPAVLGFLGTIAFRCEGPVHGGWIVLDLLGFSRQNLDLSMGCEASAEEIFLAALPLSERPPERSRACFWPMRKAGLVMGESVTCLLFFRKRLSH
jgi:hypothetical protein